MNLKEVHISNYKSIKNANLEMDRIAVLVGKNGVGKSSVLRALDLFFNEMESHDIQVIDDKGSSKTRHSGEHDNTFPVRDASIIWNNKPGTATITCIFSDVDINSIFPSVPFELKTTEGNTEVIKNIENTMTIIKEYTIANNECKFMVREIRFGDLFILRRERDKLKIAILNEPHQGLNQNLPLAITDFLGSFLLIPAKRKLSEEQKSRIDPTPDGQGIPSAMLRYEKEPKLGKMGKYKEIVKMTTRLMPTSSNVTSLTDDRDQTELYFSNYRSSSSADGDKEIFHLCFQILDSEAKFIGIEEPEIHLHPSIQKDLYSYLMNASEEKQIILTTHSPVIASRAHLDDLKFVKLLTKNETKIINKLNDTHVNQIIIELGVSPGDYFESDGVIFVEGNSDCQVFKDFWEKLYPRKKVKFLDTEGFTNMDYYANVKVLESSRVSIDSFVIFDGDTLKNPKKKKHRDEVVKRIKLKKEKILTISEHSIESYLLVLNALTKAFPNLKSNTSKIKEIIRNSKDKENKVEVLDKILKTGRYPKYDKVAHAGLIAKHIKAKDIHDDLKTVLKAISDQLTN
jgi:predicted ATP-dependent endonuclease of OLD family